MADVVVQLGAIKFDFFEVPQAIPFGGRHRTAVHQLPGGVRAVQALGRDDGPIQWEGVFLGAQAIERARAMDAMRIAGRAVTLSWHEFIYTVLVDEFTASFETPFRAPYRLSLTVVEDLTATVERAPANTVDMSIREDISECRANAALVGDPQLTGLAGALQDIAGTIQDFQHVAFATIQPALSIATDIRARVQVLQDTAGAGLKGAAALASIVPGSGGLVDGLNKAATGAMTLPALHRLDNRIGRLTTNLNAANFGATAVSRTVAGGGSLFGIAAQEYGDATRWTEIAQASGRTDPQLRGITRLTIPQR